MTQVINKVVTPEEGTSYPLKVHADNVEMPNGMSLSEFYRYVMSLATEGHFVMCSDDEPQSNNVKFWYNTSE